MNKCRTGSSIFLGALFLVVLQMGLASTRVAAQTDLPERKFVVSINPILAVFGWYTGEAEIRLQDNHTIGVSGSFWHFKTGDEGDLDYEDTQYTSFGAFYRYYPTGSFKGFFFGGQAGSVQIDQKEAVAWDLLGPPLTGPVAVTDASYNSFTVGILIGYGWILGDAQKIAVSVGIGADRLVGGDTLDEDINVTLPVIRLINVGIAF